MQPIFADYVTNIADFKRNTDSVLEHAQTATVVILVHNQPSTYLLCPIDYRSRLVKIRSKLEIETMKNNL